MSARKKLTLLGATGSVGSSTLSVVRKNPDRFVIHALTTHQRVTDLAQLCAEFRPSYVVVHTQQQQQELETLLNTIDVSIDTRVLWGKEALSFVTEEADIVVAAIVGAAGLAPTYHAAQHGKTILLANKEALVVGGEVFMQTVKQHHARLIPLDSEHNAIFQCMPQSSTDKTTSGIESIILTASGGPFLNYPLAELSQVSIEQACKHPNWSMGQKISIDSATMMNKALEMIEAHYLFDLPESRIEVLIHPQSIVHSMVRYCDGSVLAQMGNSDMRIPIAHALGFPHRIDSGAQALDFVKLARLEFLDLNSERFPAIELARLAVRSGHGAHIALNAANEIAVDAFLHQAVCFTSIYTLVETMVHRFLGQATSRESPRDLRSILELDSEIRLKTQELVETYQNRAVAL
jgi:1-deoxy-D-xylulose-5-phosphate reductoisomerase